MSNLQPDLDAIIGHRFVHQHPIPVCSRSGLEYLVGSNGVFARAARPGIDVLMPISRHEQSLKGLAKINPFMTIEPLVPEVLLLEMWRLSCQVCANPEQSLEILFHLLLIDRQWQLVVPEQMQNLTSCRPLYTNRDSSTNRAIIEIHSHGMMGAFFSSIDDQDEAFGFRIYGVLGKVRGTRPEIMLRVGLFGHCWHVPVTQVFALEGSWFMQDLSFQQSYPYYSAARQRSTA